MDYSSESITDITRRCVRTICKAPEVQSLKTMLITRIFSSSPMHTTTTSFDEHLRLSLRPPDIATDCNTMSEEESCRKPASPDKQHSIDPERDHLSDSGEQLTQEDTMFEDQERLYKEEAMWDRKIEDSVGEIAEIRKGIVFFEELISTILHIRDSQLIKGTQILLRDMYDTLYDPSPDVCNRYKAFTGRDMSLYNQDISDELIWRMMNDGKYGMFEETRVYDPADAPVDNNQYRRKTLNEFMKTLVDNLDISIRLRRGFFWEVVTKPGISPEQEEKVHSWVWQKLQENQSKTPTISFWEHRRKKGVIVVFFGIDPSS